MTVSPNGHHPLEEEDEFPSGWRWNVPRAFGLIGFLGMAVFWIWIFTVDSDAPDRFDDPEYVAAAEALCSVRQEAIAELGNASEAATPELRAVQLRAATVELERMVAELNQLGLPDDPKGAGENGVPRWLGEYEIHLEDRRVWADKLATGLDTEFLGSGNADGARITRTLDTFADVNGMPSCAPSLDV